jgi:hypothetical protein
MDGILLACQVESISTRKDKTVKITLGSQELSQGKAGEVFSLTNKMIVVYISPKDAIDQKEIDQVDKIDPDFSAGKTQSQRLRNVFFKLFEQSRDGHKDFDTYYRSKMELVIEHYKTKINP